MTHNEIQTASLLDLLFAGRNKQYGAYRLRKEYNGRLGAALALTMAAALLIFFLIRFLAQPGTDLVTEKRGRDVIVDLPPAPKIPEPKVQPQKTHLQQFKTEHLSNNIVIDKTKTDVADIDKLDKALIGFKTIDGPDAPPDIDVTAPVGPGPQGPVAAAAPVEPEPTFVAHPSVAPEFPGGPEAWMTFLRNRISPPADMQPGEKRSVLVRFLVAEDGSVTSLEIIRSAGASFDNEVLRALKRMPKWKPARQNGRAVATSFQQPVTFATPED